MFYIFYILIECIHFVKTRHMLCHQPKSDRPIKCDSCALVFDSLIELKSHLEQGICTHTDHMSDTTASNNDSLSALHFKTSPTLSTNGALKDGPTTHRLYPFVCETCGKAFQTYPNLRQHTISHENERKFNCHLCPKVFKRSTGLNQVRRYVFFLCMLRILFSLFCCLCVLSAALFIQFFFCVVLNRTLSHTHFG